jgi:uncharacterized protein (TIGR00369 family)
MPDSFPIPDGFRKAHVHGDFVAFNGPLYGRLSGDSISLGFRVEQRHTNPMGICHGGMLATFVDMLVPCTAMYTSGRERRFLPTISLQIDYLGPSKLGPGCRVRRRSCVPPATWCSARVWSARTVSRHCVSAASSSWERHGAMSPTGIHWV